MYLIEYGANCFNKNVQILDSEDNACTQRATGFFAGKYKILQLYPNSHSFCTAK